MGAPLTPLGIILLIIVLVLDNAMITCDILIANIMLQYLYMCIYIYIERERALERQRMVTLSRANGFATARWLHELHD